MYRSSGEHSAAAQKCAPSSAVRAYGQGCAQGTAGQCVPERAPPSQGLITLLRQEGHRQASFLGRAISLDNLLQ